MNKWHAILYGMLTALTIIGLAAQSRAQSAGALGPLIPKEVAFSLVLEHPQSLGNAFLRTRLGQILLSDGWKHYRQTLRDEHVFSALHLRPQFGLDWDDLVEIDAPTVLMGIGGTHPGCAMLVAIDEQRARQHLIPRVMLYFDSLKASHAAYGYHNAIGERLTFSTSAEKDQERVIFYHANCLAVFSSQYFANAWQDFVATQSSESPASSQGFNDPNREIAQSASFVIHPDNLVEWLSPAAGSPAAATPNWQASLRRQGIADLTRLSANLQLIGSAPIDIQVDWNVDHRPDLSKGMRVLAFVPSAISAPATWIDSTVTSWSSTSRDISTWFEGIGSWFDERTDPEVPGAFEDVIDGLASDPEGPQIRVREEVVSRLTGQITTVSWPQMLPANGGQRPAAIAIGVNDAAGLSKVFERYFAGDDVIQTGEMNNTRYWHSRAGEALFMATGEANQESPTAIALSTTTLVLSNQWSTIEGLLKRDPSATPLAKSERYLAARAVLERLSDQNTAGASIFSPTPFFAEAYRGILPSSRSEQVASTLTEALAQLLAGANWRTQSRVISQLPAYDDGWLSPLSDIVTGIHVAQARLWGASYLLLKKD